jgi:hypothetical protein
MSGRLVLVDLATPEILSVGDGLQMGRVHTRRVATEMVEIQAFRNGPYKRLVDRPMERVDAALVGDGSVTRFTRYNPAFPRPIEPSQSALETVGWEDHFSDTILPHMGRFVFSGTTWASIRTRF